MRKNPVYRDSNSRPNMSEGYEVTSELRGRPAHTQNTRGCQSGTWSAGQKKIRGTSTKLQGEQKKNTHTKKKTKTKERNNNKIKYTRQKKIEERHPIERVWYSASREPSDALPGSQPCTQTRSIYHTPYSQGFSFL